ncbi:sensor domain-containing diguanylate cyclase [Saccharospirillum impatiens]|uniref:sensor domain-containing diguanylate cyclase n=1 Tax=Saccharospirillum impatiens TaxID=169438 RepID=UPI000415431F|nr:diguanylate cyclase [Saccharospirillum impatiens]
MRRKSRRQGWCLAIFTTALVWVFASLLNTAYAVVLSANQLPDDLTGSAELLQEPPDTQAWGLNTVLRKPNADWTPISDSVLNFSFDPSAYWVRFTLHNPTDTNIRLILDVAQPLQDYIDAWLLDGNKSTVQSWQTGDRRPASDRPFLYRAFAFPISIAPDQQIQFIARFDSHDGLYDALPLALMSQGSFFMQKDREALWFGFYYGAITILLLYNLFVGIATRERDFLLYSLYLSCFLLWNLAFRGYLALGPLANAPILNNIATAFFGGSIFITLIIFTRRFLALNTRMPRTSRCLLFLAMAMLIPVVLSTLDYYAFAFQLIIPAAMITMLTVLAVAIYLSWQGLRTARIYLLAWVLLIASAFAYYGRVLSLVPSTWLTENALNIGSLIELLVLSLAMADRIRSLKLERIENQSYLFERERGMNQELKEQVAIKTRELKQLANRFEQDSITDALTGLKNRRTFESTLEQSVRSKDRDNPWLCLALIDLDYFKNFNDQFGHPAGDVLLTQLGQLLQRTFQRSDDHVFRIGGEEFGVVFRTESSTAIKQMLHQFQAALTVISSTTDTTPITASIGVACVLNGSDVTPDNLYVRADELLYQCKEKGRNQFLIERIDTPADQ